MEANAFDAGFSLADSYAGLRGGFSGFVWDEYRVLQPSLGAAQDYFELMRESRKRNTARWQHDTMQFGLSLWAKGARSSAVSDLAGYAGHAWTFSEDLRRGMNTVDNVRRAWSLLDIPSSESLFSSHTAYERGRLSSYDPGGRGGSAVEWTFTDRSYWRSPFTGQERSAILPGPIIRTEFQGSAVSYRDQRRLPRGHVSDIAIRKAESHEERYNRFGLASLGSFKTTRLTNTSYRYQFDGAQEQHAIEKALARERHGNYSLAGQPSVKAKTLGMPAMSGGRTGLHKSSQNSSLASSVPEHTGTVGGGGRQLELRTPDVPEPRRRRDKYGTLGYSPFFPPPPPPPPGIIHKGNSSQAELGRSGSRHPKGVLTETIADAWVDEGAGGFWIVFTLDYSPYVCLEPEDNE